MAFTVSDFHDLVQLLEQHPEWQAELRRLVLSRDLLELPDLVRELAEAQRRTEARVEELAEAQSRTEARLGELAEAQSRTEARLGELAEAQKSTEARLGALAATQENMIGLLQKLAGDTGILKGFYVEYRYRDKASAFFGQLIRRAHPLTNDEVNALLDRVTSEGLLTEEEADDLNRADIIVRGRRAEDRAELYLVVEVSWGIGIGDVERARRRAALLEKAGTTALPLVAGGWITPDAEEVARSYKVPWVVNLAAFEADGD